MDSQFAHSRLIWRHKDPKNCRVEAFRRWVNRKHGLHLSKPYLTRLHPLTLNVYPSPIEDYHELHKYSVTDYTFWQDLWQYLNIVYSVPPDKVRTESEAAIDVITNYSLDRNRGPHA